MMAIGLARHGTTIMTTGDETDRREPVPVRLRGDGEAPYDVDTSVYRRFDQRNELFSRETWDPAIRDVEAPLRRTAPQGDGFTRLDLAFHAAALGD